METVETRTAILESPQCCIGLRQSYLRLFTRRVDMEATESQGSGPVFHFSEAPTVTTGFIVLVFDIRREQK